METPPDVPVLLRTYSSTAKNLNATTVDKTSDEYIEVVSTVSPVDDFPDGGFRAWAVLFGVRPCILN
jgi:hypothetical protein